MANSTIKNELKVAKQDVTFIYGGYELWSPSINATRIMHILNANYRLKAVGVDGTWVKINAVKPGQADEWQLVPTTDSPLTLQCAVLVGGYISSLLRDLAIIFCRILTDKVGEQYSSLLILQQIVCK